MINENNIKEYEARLYDEEKSKNTITKYIRDVKAFLTWCEGRVMDKATVLDYKTFLCSTYSPKSVNSILSSLNNYFMYIERPELKVKILKIQRKIFTEQSRELTKNDYRTLLCTAKNKKDKRLYCLIQTIGSTGMRVSELEYVTVDAVRSGIVTINCKGKLRQILLPADLCRLLKKYIVEKGIKKGSVFISKNGKPLDRIAVWRMLKSICDEAGVQKEKVFPHNLRHLFARTFYTLYNDIVGLADILGHSNINTTRIYTAESGAEYSHRITQMGLLLC